MNQMFVFALMATIIIGLAIMWDTTRGQLVRVRSELRALEDTRAADNEALTRMQTERDEIARKYEAVSRELMEITDESSVDYLNTPVPGSVRRLLEQ